MERPVPPPITTILGPFTNNLFSYIRFCILSESKDTFIYPLFISAIIPLITSVTETYKTKIPVIIKNT
ncbi:hypothetical protein D3C75_1166490 [compost metagenome]